MVEDVGDLLRVQLGVHRQRDEASPPARIEQLDVDGRVAHQQRDAIAGDQTEPPTQGPGQPGDAVAQHAEIGDQVGPETERGRLGPKRRGARQMMSDVHGRRPCRMADGGGNGCKPV